VWASGGNAVCGTSRHQSFPQPHYTAFTGKGQRFSPLRQSYDCLRVLKKHFKLECDKDIFTYFHTHYLHFFPKLADRSLFARHAANLWQIKTAIQQRLTRISGQLNDPVQAIDIAEAA
jgi:hypothetical protein